MRLNFSGSNKNDGNYYPHLFDERENILISWNIKSKRTKTAILQTFEEKKLWRDQKGWVTVKGERELLKFCHLSLGQDNKLLCLTSART